MAPLPVTLRREIAADFQALPTDALRLEALRYLVRLKTAPRLGLRLTDHPVLGDLSDCRKIYFDERPDVPPRYRIVYRLTPNDAKPSGVDVVVIGRRARASVYFDAILRLGRRSVGNNP